MILSYFVTGSFNISGKKMTFKQTLEMVTKHALTTNSAVIFLSLALSVDQKKWKISVLLSFKSKLLWKLSFDDKSLTIIRRESEKTLVEWFWRVLGRLRLADSRQTSKLVSLCDKNLGVSIDSSSFSVMGYFERILLLIYMA